MQISSIGSKSSYAQCIRVIKAYIATVSLSKLIKPLYAYTVISIKVVTDNSPMYMICSKMIEKNGSFKWFA